MACISANKCIARFDNPKQTEAVYRKLLAEGKFANLERGLVIQHFKGMSQKQIEELVKRDIKESSASVDVEISDYEEKRI